MTNIEFEQKLKTLDFKVISKVIVYRKAPDGWSDGVDVSRYVSGHNDSSEWSLGAGKLDVDFIDAEDLFWVNKDSPYNKSISGREVEHKFGEGGSIYYNVELRDIKYDLASNFEKGYIVSPDVEDENPSEGYLVLDAVKQSDEDWGSVYIVAECLGDQFSSIEVDLIFSNTGSDFVSSQDKVHNHLFLDSTGRSRIRSRVPKEFNKFNYCRVSMRIKSPNAPYGEAIVKGFSMSVINHGGVEKYDPLVYWGNRIKLEEEIIFSDGTKKRTTKFLGVIDEVPPDFSASERGRMSISAQDMMYILNTEIYERPRRDRKTIYSNNRSTDLGILEPNKISQDTTNKPHEDKPLELVRLSKNNDIIPINEEDEGYIFAVPLDFRNNPTCTNMGDGIVRMSRSSSQVIRPTNIIRSERLIPNDKESGVFYVPDWWRDSGANIIFKIRPPNSFAGMSEGDSPTFESGYISASINNAVYSTSNYYGLDVIVPLPADGIFHYSIVDAYGPNNSGRGEVYIEIDGYHIPPDVGDPMPEDVHFQNIIIPSGVRAVEVSLGYVYTSSQSDEGFQGMNVSIGGDSSLVGKSLRANGRPVRFSLSPSDAGKSLLVSVTDIEYFMWGYSDMASNGGTLTFDLSCKFLTDSNEYGDISQFRGDRKYVNWAKLPQAVIYDISSVSDDDSDSKSYTEADGVQIDYARGVVYMPHKCEKVKARFKWYDMDTNRFEEVVADIIKDAFWSIEGYSPLDWILVDKNGQKIASGRESPSDAYYPSEEKRKEPLIYIYAPNGERTNLRIELEKSYPRSTIPRTIFNLEDKKTHFQAIQELLNQRYVDPSYRIYINVDTIYDENGLEVDNEIVFKGQYQRQKYTKDANIVLYKNVRYPLDNNELYTKVVAYGVKPSVPNVALGSKVVFYKFLGDKSKQYGTSPNSIVDGDINSSKNYYGYYTTNDDVDMLLPTDAVRIEIKNPIRLGRVDILWGRADNSSNVSGFGARIKVSEDGKEWYPLKEDGSGDTGSSGQWSSVSESQFDPAIKNLNIKFIMIEATSLAGYTRNAFQSNAYCWCIREVQIFPSDEIREEVTIDDLLQDENVKGYISVDTVDLLKKMLGEKTKVLPRKTNLMDSASVRDRALDTLFEVCRMLYRAEVDAIYLPHIKVGMTVGFADAKNIDRKKLVDVDRVYFVESISHRKDGSKVNCALRLVSWD